MSLAIRRKTLKPCANHGSRRQIGRSMTFRVESSKEQGKLGNILHRREFVVHGLGEHDLLNDSFLPAMLSSLACSGICFSTRGVFTKPGQMTLARTLCLAPSSP